MAEHTPGPWAAPYFDKNPGDEGWWVHNGQRGQDEYAIAVTFRLNPRAEADARLIAAAPEMLECLKVFLAPDDLTAWDIGVWMEQARLVVAKAEGKQP